MKNVEIPNHAEQTLRNARDLAISQNLASLVGELNTILRLIQSQEFVVYPIPKSSLVSEVLVPALYSSDYRVRVSLVSGDVWEYKVPFDKAQSFLVEAQKSAGTAFNNHLKGKFPSSQIF